MLKGLGIFKTRRIPVALAGRRHRFECFVLASYAVAFLHVCWVGFFMLRRTAPAGQLGDAYLLETTALKLFLFNWLLQLALMIWYLGYFLRTDRLTLIGMLSIVMPFLLLTAYFSTAPTNVLLYAIVEASNLGALTMWSQLREEATEA